VALVYKRKAKRRQQTKRVGKDNPKGEKEQGADRKGDRTKKKRRTNDKEKRKRTGG